MGLKYLCTQYGNFSSLKIPPVRRKYILIPTVLLLYEKKMYDFEAPREDHRISASENRYISECI